MHIRLLPRLRHNHTILVLAAALGGLAAGPGAVAQDHSATGSHTTPVGAKKVMTPKEIGAQVKEAVDSGAGSTKRLTLTVSGKEKNLISMPEPSTMTKPVGATHGAPVAVASAHMAAAPVAVAPGAILNPVASREFIRAKAAALTGHPVTPGNTSHGAAGLHWAYDGENGPQAWGRLKPDFYICAIGKCQSPINIDDSVTLRGPAEPIQFDYAPSNGTVVNNGHTIQVDLVGDNSITVRGSSYKLLQFHFHHPSEERVNERSFAMVAHLVHRNPEGQLAVVAVLLEPGTANGMINKVWTYMPLDAGDRVRMPAGMAEMAELLPKDQRYYQFIGSLTTPPCTEGVLWLVLKQPVTISREQLRMFRQLFPNNARPLQALNGRAVRDAQ